MKLIILLITLPFALLKSQSVNLEWVNSFSNTNFFNQDIHVDIDGNVIIAGNLRGTLDFENGPGVTEVAVEEGAEAAFVSKFNPDGFLIWVKVIQPLSNTSSSIFEAVDSDSSANIVLAGNYINQVDLDPGILADSVTSTDVDMFILKLDSSGELLWKKQFIGAGDGYINTCRLDQYGNIYAAGNFKGNVNLDAGQSSQIFTAETIFGASFLLKLSSDGNYVWAKTVDKARTNNIFVDNNLYIYSTGGFRGPTDFDSGSNQTILTHTGTYGNDIFVSKHDSSGNLIWAKSMGGSNQDQGDLVTVNSSGNVIITGNFGISLVGDTADFDPGPSFFPLTPLGTSDMFLAQLDSTGSFISTAQFGGPYISSIPDTRASSLMIDGLDNLYISGIFADSCDFDPGPGEYLVYGHSIRAFISKFDNTGNLLWIDVIEPAFYNDYVISDAATMVEPGVFYMCGRYSGETDFDLSQGFNSIENTSGASLSGYIVKYTENQQILISEKSFNDGGLIFPNPSTGLFTLNLKETSVNFEIYNSLGNLIKIQQAFEGNNNIDISEQNKGIYILKINDLNNNFTISKVVKL